MKNQQWEILDFGKGSEGLADTQSNNHWDKLLPVSNSKNRVGHSLFCTKRVWVGFFQLV